MISYVLHSKFLYLSKCVMGRRDVTGDEYENFRRSTRSHHFTLLFCQFYSFLESAPASCFPCSSIYLTHSTPERTKQTWKFSMLWSMNSYIRLYHGPTERMMMHFFKPVIRIRKQKEEFRNNANMRSVATCRGDTKFCMFSVRWKKQF